MAEPVALSCRPRRCGSENAVSAGRNRPSSRNARTSARPKRSGPELAMWTQWIFTIRMPGVWVKKVRNAVYSTIATTLVHTSP
jgi:hypothetical protein